MLKISKLGDVCKIQSGNSIPAKEKDDLYRNVNEGLPYVATKDIGIDGSINFENGVTIPSKFNSKFRLSEKDSVLICAEGGSAGKKIAYSNKDCYFVNKLLSIKPKNEIDAKYIYYYTLGNEFQYQFRKSIHGLIGGVSLSKIKSFQITYPPLSEQQRIVAKLDLIFAEIEKLEKKTACNLSNVNLFFKKSLDKIIENGEKRKISDIADLIDSLHKTPKKYVEQGYPMVRVTDVKEGPLKLNKTKKVDKITFEEFTKRYTTNIGDIVFSRVGSYGISSYVNTNEKFCLGQNTVIIIPKINSKFLYYFLNSDFAKIQFRSKVSGVTQPTISLKSIKEIILKVPDKKTQEKMVIQMDNFYEYKNNLIRNYNNKISSLKKLRNLFLTELLNKNNLKILQ